MYVVRRMAGDREARARALSAGERLGYRASGSRRATPGCHRPLRALRVPPIPNYPPYDERDWSVCLRPSMERGLTGDSARTRDGWTRQAGGASRRSRITDPPLRRPRHHGPSHGDLGAWSRSWTATSSGSHRDLAELRVAASAVRSASSTNSAVGRLSGQRREVHELGRVAPVALDVCEPVERLNSRS
jgi:hypothetical protein